MTRGACVLVLQAPELEASAVLLTDRTWISFARLLQSTPRPVWLFPSPAAALTARRHSWHALARQILVVPVRGPLEVL